MWRVCRMPRMAATGLLQRTAVVSGSKRRYCSGEGREERVRVRYAPSPTGELHLGGLRTALYNLMLAKRHGGEFILRVEDTDRTRYVAGSIGRLVRHFKWLKMMSCTEEEISLIDRMEEEWQRESDSVGGVSDTVTDEEKGKKVTEGKRDNRECEEGEKASERHGSDSGEEAKALFKGRDGGMDGAVFVQSRDMGKYRRYAEELLDKGYAYRCFCTSEELATLREKGKKKHAHFLYDDGALTEEQVAARLEAATPFTIRMKIPRTAEVLHDDLVKGSIAFQCNTVDDQVLLKSDGWPTYHLASVVDDHLMAVTHVVRGEEWLPSVSKHLLLYRYFGWKAPRFAHLPLLLNKNGSKLSKRQNDTSLQFYREQRVEPEALLNYVALLGWSPTADNGKEVLTLPEMCSQFELERVSKSGAMLNFDKLLWLNGQHLRLQCANDAEALLERVLPVWREVVPEDALEKRGRGYLLQVVRLITSRMQRVEDYKKAAYFFSPPDLSTDAAVQLRKKAWKDNSYSLLLALAEELEAEAGPNAGEQEVQAAIGRALAREGAKQRDLFMPLRYLLTGTSVGAAVPETMALLGVAECAARLRSGL
eukprot:CAMPEP_0114605350 /NCGR_PEP_ID=MMETSP0168-20121206/1011_1 /TAXON_ID=95228 ORGANISM="Vannella sp., Strain DIVA3 517/6/12" /NCGR_SAMPLE_ID=MMETSP0168 /ASSEMBLY_ACC=CAM_ASM_000044 /LENGTH=592 /DNA_ID=CAMNT_0001816201 /DNA_START=93 /DNA_END=1869 /DNA_ORIENTATION=+